MVEYIKMISDHAREIRIFIITGIALTILSLGIFTLLTEWLQVWYLTASIIAFVITFIVNFFLQKIWTFQDSRGETHVQMSLFFVNSLGNLVLNTALMYGMVDVLRMHHILAQGIVIGILAVMNFVVYRFYIFRRHEVINVGTV